MSADKAAGAHTPADIGGLRIHGQAVASTHRIGHSARLWLPWGLLREKLRQGYLLPSAGPVGYGGLFGDRSGGLLWDLAANSGQIPLLASRTTQDCRRARRGRAGWRGLPAAPHRLALTREDANSVRQGRPACFRKTSAGSSASDAAAVGSLNSPPHARWCVMPVISRHRDRGSRAR